MFQRLRSLFQDNSILKYFEKASMDSTHSPINMSMISESRRFLDHPEQRRMLLQCLVKGMNSSRWVKKLKYLMVIHYMLIYFPQFRELEAAFISECEMRQYEQQNTISDVRVWIDNVVIRHYMTYLCKLTSHIDFIQECRSCHKLPTIGIQLLLVNGFKALNLINFIIETKVNFNKLGRYYQELKIVLDLFKVYLKDVNYLYCYIKMIIDELLNHPKSIAVPMLQHSFAFLNETLKTSDQLYEFYHNRYYFKSMKEFNFPNFYKLDFRKYKTFVKVIRKQLPNQQFEKLQFYFSADKREELNMNKTLITLNKDEEDFCQHLEKTLMQWDVRHQQAFQPQKITITEGDQTDI